MKQEMIFISYSRVNSDFAVRLAKDLDLAGINAWIDQSDIPTGARWDDTLQRAIDDSSVFLVLLSPESTRSQNVKDEIGYAIDIGKRILPILVRPCTIPLRLRRFQYVDFTNNPYEKSLGEIKGLLGYPPTSIQRETEAEKPAKAEPIPQIHAQTSPSSKMIIAGISIVALALLGTIIFLSEKNSSSIATRNQQSTKIPAFSPPTIQPNIVELSSINCGRQEDACGTGSPIDKYSHFPPIGKIRYTLTVDDELEKVELVCVSSTSNITELFMQSGIFSNDSRTFGSGTFPVYQSDTIDVPLGCRVDFTLRNTIGDISGMSLSFTIVP